MTHTIDARDPRFMTTFPRLVVPREDEGVVGLSLRCDELNGWPAGSSMRAVYPHGPGLGSAARSMCAFVTGSTLDLDGLATRLALDVGAIERTTFRRQVARLCAPEPPNARLFGTLPPFRVCPVCVATDRLLLRWAALPILQSCPRHGVLLQERCLCGRALNPFRRQSTPFVCGQCARPWQTLPAERVGEEAARVDREVLALFAAFLQRGEPAWMADAIMLMQGEMATHGLRRLPTLAGGRGVVPRCFTGYHSLAAIVSGLAALHLPGAALERGTSPTEAAPACCLNRTCPLFGLVDGGNVCPLRRHGVERETYCTECGSRFFRNRVYMSFDAGCAPTGAGPLPAAIARAQERLALWRQQLDAACRALFAAGTPLSLIDAFAQAGIPRTPNLRARRLGLVYLVDSYAALQREEAPPPGPERWDIRKHQVKGGFRYRQADRQACLERHARKQEVWAARRSVRPTYPTDLNDEEWARIQPLIPQGRLSLGISRHERREVVNAILYVLQRGGRGQWAAGLPPDLPPCRSVHCWYGIWRRAGVWAQIEAALRDRSPT